MTCPPMNFLANFLREAWIRASDLRHSKGCISGALSVGLQAVKSHLDTVLYCTVLYCTVLYCTVLYCTVLYCTVLYCTVLYCTVLYCTVLGANRQSSVLVNSVSQYTLATRKLFPEKLTICIWLTPSYEAWYCTCTSLLKKICMLVPNVTVSWTIKDEMLFILYIL